ncbi:putative O-glycosylation ligase, exosortase A system-associated [Massilia sp. CFBP9026]|uniref:putative O-glycosylation ligase, exosortase A system-associated n=1 Tax=Massilia sp. CFBP9026 TaxID=3096536 RepID=UPI002A6A5E1D|nr:putative O-glycosylation ligase, exosortase A system-associated [Massilia sp. CFBP9026]MDY0963394.1 putative O-glycosylation ligase, exosortase A system-associated [Massilia sp. CFBP9026]
MRDLILLLAFVAIIPYIFKRPVVGAMAYAVVSLMNPHRLSYGFTQFFPFAMYLSIITLVAVMLSREPKKIPMSPLVVVLAIFFGWMTVTTIFAQVPAAAWQDWDRFSKIVLMVFITIMTVRTRKDAKMLAIVVALSLGFWGVKSGIFVIFSGGGEGLLGPRASFISDNNTLALALVTITPLLVYLVTQVDGKWLKRGVLAMAGLTALGAIGSYSRGAFLAVFMMGFFLWLKSHHKLKTGIAFLLIVPIVLLAMPEAWMGRMNTIQTYDEDASATGRINSWLFAINIANEFVLGGGPNVFAPHMFMLYAPEPERYFDAHSIYFQILGEQGYIGLGIFLFMFVVAWRLGSRVIRFCSGKEDLAWALMLARMCHVSIIGYMTAGAFLTLAYYDLIYYVFAILITLDKVLIRAPVQEDIPPMRIPFMQDRIDRWLGKAPDARAQR